MRECDCDRDVFTNPESLEQRVTFEMLEQQIKELKKATDHLLEETKELRKVVSKSWIL